MSAASIITEVQAVGGHIEAHDGKLRLTAPNPLPDELVALIKDHKPELLATIQKDIDSVLHGIPICELRRLAGSDWKDIENDPDILDSFAHAVSTRRMRELGQRPVHYTQISICRRCGPVWLWTDAPQKVEGCPWCFNRVKGLPIQSAENDRT